MIIGPCSTLSSIYTDLHRHPELSMLEYRTATTAADHVEALGYDVTREVGVTGVVAVLRLPSNHSPRCAPVIHPTLLTGLQALLAAAGAWLGAQPTES